MSSHLFIGGPADGQWIDTEGCGDTYTVAMREPLGGPASLSAESPMPFARTVTYRAIHLCDDRAKWRVYVGRDVEGGVMKHLLHGYIGGGTRFRVASIPSGWVHFTAEACGLGRALLQVFTKAFARLGKVDATIVIHDRNPPE